MNTCIPQEVAAKLKESLKKGEIDANAIAKMLPEEKAALKSILEDVVAERLGVNVSAGEVAEIQTKAKKIDETYKKLGTEGENLGNPAKLQENVDFFKAKKEMDDYLMSKHPANRLKVMTGTVGRGVMLASVKSPLLNIGSNIELGFTEALGRRIANRQLTGTDTALATDFVKMANKIYQESGYDISRMTTLKDSGVAGERVLGQTVHAQGPGAVRKVGRVVEDVVFKQLMGAPDVAFSSAHFADSVNLNARKIAGGDVVKAKEYMQDSMRLEPKTPEGQLLREQAIMDAQKATWTDSSWASKVSEGIRKVINDVSGDARIGDYVLPFVKTPANVIATGMDYAGMGVPKALVRTYKAFKSGELKSPEYTRALSRDLVRSGLGLTGAVIIASQLNPDDFVGAYDPARAQIEQLRNSNYNAIRVGNKWISVDWLGPLAVPVTSMMYAKKYGKTPGEKTFQYGKGVVSAIQNLPGISDVFDYVKTNAYKKNQSIEEMTGEAESYIISQLSSRLIPSIVSDVAKVVDPTVRKTNKGWEQAIVAKIPFLSKTLPAKTSIFGEEVKGEPGWSDILFGSRVKTSKEIPIITELNTVSEDTGKGITFTDWDKSSSKTLAQFKEKVGQEKFNQAKISYGQKLKEKITDVTAKNAYQKLSPEDKLKVINGLDATVMSDVFKKYGFKYKAEKSKKLPKL